MKKVNKYRGFAIERGDYLGTSDNRSDRWYVSWPYSRTIDRRGGGFYTIESAKSVIDSYLVLLGAVAHKIEREFVVPADDKYGYPVGRGKTAKAAAAMHFGCEESDLVFCGYAGRDRGDASLGTYPKVRRNVGPTYLPKSQKGWA